MFCRQGHRREKSEIWVEESRVNSIVEGWGKGF